MRKSKVMSKIFATAMAGLLLFSSTMFSEATGVDGFSLRQSKDKQISAMIAKKNVKNTKKKTKTTKTNKTKSTKNTKPAQVKKIKRIDPVFGLNAADANIEFVLTEEGTPLKVAYDKKTHAVLMTDNKRSAEIIITPVITKTKGSPIKIYVPNEKWSKIKLVTAGTDISCQNIFKSGTMEMNFEGGNSTISFAEGFNSNLDFILANSKMDISLPNNFTKEFKLNAGITDLKIDLPETFAGIFDGIGAVSNIDFKLAGGYKNSDVEIRVSEGQVSVPEYFSSDMMGYQHSADNEKSTIKWSLDPTSVVNFAS